MCGFMGQDIIDVPAAKNVLRKKYCIKKRKWPDLIADQHDPDSSVVNPVMGEIISAQPPGMQDKTESGCSRACQIKKKQELPDGYSAAGSSVGANRKIGGGQWLHGSKGRGNVNQRQYERKQQGKKQIEPVKGKKGLVL